MPLSILAVRADSSRKKKHVTFCGFRGPKAYTSNYFKSLLPNYADLAHLLPNNWRKVRELFQGAI